MLFRNNYILSIFFLINFSNSYAQRNVLSENDSSKVDDLNKKGYSVVLSSSEETINYGRQAFKLANQIKYQKGKGEALRIIGIGYLYQNETDSAANNYFKALNIFEELNDRKNVAKVLNNIGYLYYTYDNTKAIEYYKKSLSIANKYNDKELIGGILLNIGNVFFSKKYYNQALNYYKKSYSIFDSINFYSGITQSLQNQGVIYYRLNQNDLAKKYLLQANEDAKKYGLNNTVAGINLTLVTIFLRERKFDLSEKFLNEGEAYAKLVDDRSKVDDYTFERYELEKNKGDFKKALEFLELVHVRDSINFNENISNNIKLSQKSNEQEQREIRNNLLLANKKNDEIIKISGILFSLLCVFIILLLIRNIKSSKLNNIRITALNKEISEKNIKIEQDNQILEDLVLARTHDLVIKNQKLSEYSSHLSHQIRGPIATLKGLILLSEEDLIDEKELVPSMKKCVNEIDHQILTINDALHNPEKNGLT